MQFYAEDLLSLLPRELAEAVPDAETTVVLERRFMAIIRDALTEFAQNGGCTP